MAGVSLPSCSSDFRASHLNELCIEFKELDETKYVSRVASSLPVCQEPLYKWFFQKIGKINAGNLQWWDGLDQFVEKSARRIHAAGKFTLINEEKATCDKFNDTFAGIFTEESDSLLKKLINDVHNMVLSASVNRRKTFDRDEYESIGKAINFLSVLEDEILHKTVAGNSPKEASFVNLFQRLANMCLMNICIGKAINFLSVLEDEILHKTVAGNSPKEASFVNLFQRLANMCLMNICPGSSVTRTMNLLGNTVTSMPDLQYGMYNDLPDIPAKKEFLVVTVGEFKGGQKDEFHDDSEKRTYDLRVREQKVQCVTALGDELDVDDDGRDKKESISRQSPTPRPAKKRRISREDYDVGYGSRLKGQHAVELLLELPYTAMKEFGNPNCMFGFVIQGTKVRLTSLEINPEHLKKIQENKYEGVGREKAYVYYTRYYDLLNQDDRNELECVLLTLSFLANDRSIL